jgi:hypothetical protein
MNVQYVHMGMYSLLKCYAQLFSAYLNYAYKRKSVKTNR